MKHEDAQREMAVGLLNGAPLDTRIAEHLSTCGECAAEQASLRSVAQLLSQLALDDVVTPLPVSAASLLPRLLERVAAERARQRRTRRWALASGLALAATVLVIVLASMSGTISSAQHAITASASANGIVATALITPVDSGSELRLQIRGVPRGTRCVLRVESARSKQTLTVWTADYYGTATTRGHSNLAPADITRITVSRVGGAVLLTIPVSA